MRPLAAGKLIHKQPHLDLYADGDQLVFMDKDTFEQIQLPADLLGGADAFDSAVTVLFYVGFVPLAGLLLLPFVTETKDLALTD